MNMYNSTPNEIFNNYNFNSSMNNDKDKDIIISNVSNSFPSNNYEYITKGRKTMYNSSMINLNSPKKENLTRSKRMSLLGKTDFDSNINKNNPELFSFGKSSIINSGIRINYNGKEENKDSEYKKLIKKISNQLKRRIKLPTCKIIKIYQPYRTLILRIAQGIKRTAKSIDNIKYINKNKKRYKFEITLLKKDDNKNSIINELSLNTTEKKEREENINALLSIDDSFQNINFINQFENFLKKNNLEILLDTKMPSFNNENNKYLLSNLYFWVKYIKYICLIYKSNLSFFNFMNYVEQFYIWVDINKYDSNIFNKLILEKIELIFNKDYITNILLTQKLKSLDEIFSKYRNINNIDYKEVKLSDVCLCPRCKLRQKVFNYNKKNIYISYSDENNLIYDRRLKTIKFSKTKTKIDNSFKNISVTNNNNLDKKITDYCRYALEPKPKIKNPNKKINKYNDEKNLLSYYYPFTGEKNENTHKKLEEEIKNEKINKYKDKKLSDYFQFAKEKKEGINMKQIEEEEKQKSNIKEIDKNVQNDLVNGKIKNKINNKKNKHGGGDTKNNTENIKEILSLLNIEI